MTLSEALFDSGTYWHRLASGSSAAAWTIAMMPARIGSWSVARTPMGSVIPASLPTELWVSWHTACTYHFGGCLHFRRAQNPKAMLTTEMTAVRMIISQESSTCYHSCTRAV